jgi:hypothetical protein
VAPSLDVSIKSTLVNGKIPVALILIVIADVSPLFNEFLVTAVTPKRLELLRGASKVVTILIPVIASEPRFVRLSTLESELFFPNAKEMAGVSVVEDVTNNPTILKIYYW